MGRGQGSMLVRVEGIFVERKSATQRSEVVGKAGRDKPLYIILKQYRTSRVAEGRKAVGAGSSLGSEA